MRKNIHPKYQQVLFIDSATDYKFVCGSTLQPKEKAEFQGTEYPVIRLPTSSSSHPYFTGSKQLVDAEGRVDRFKRRYEKKEASETNEEGQEAKVAVAAPKKSRARK